ncbi:PAAR domain-containing protein [Xenorhabdus szentirmaii]|nr:MULTISPECIES: PAAR domain-containing protein [Xenorhabdus]MBD2801994.1 PAAR domain-containing protein [Xenorhabdus sp. M]MBD2803247.1 PAAR domain-containing protein [Xenorhabdus sp. ZM]MBD2825539.1 PAAR domain-containing protein [Xenorhabdus sp. 5]PHM35233.1 hypothetical protein Xsze_01700 [Xenorhabdus szentirmaii DSM 16338]PHM44034.1 hypothetical protein Xszus_03858 [Xenorhabdus szentirmaii]
MKKIIRVGDTLREHGGKVVSGSYQAFGKPVACVGDAVVCNEHGRNSIAQGASGSTINGKPVALDGHRCECGCTLVSSLSDMDIRP